MSSKRYHRYPIDEYISFLGRFLISLHRRFLPLRGTISILVSLTIHVNIILFFGHLLKVSSNFFVLIPLITSSFAQGFAGGLIAGLLAVPVNMLLFYLIGHPEYAPESFVIAESATILIGLVMGSMSDFFYTMNREIQKRKITEEELRQTLEDKELLLQELNHRVRNNLSIITSLIQLQMNRTENNLFKEEVQKLKQRIFSISLVHEQLYKGGHSVLLDLKDYLMALLENLVSGAWTQDIQLKASWPETEPLLVSDKVIYLGLIVHEVIINSLKHAFRETDSPQIIFKLIRDKEQYQIVIRDNGCGFDPEEVVSGLGMKLIHSLCSQVDGDFRFLQERGMVFILTFSVI